MRTFHLRFRRARVVLITLGFVSLVFGMPAPDRWLSFVAGVGFTLLVVAATLEILRWRE